ncbi:MAG: dTMP kinase [Clostridia bacterium]|nr:dTMP kinase [Clostridia bacterium]
MRCVIFDLDGTLTQSDEGIFKSIVYAAEKLGFAAPDPADRRKFVGPPLDYSFREYLGMSEDEARKAVAAYRERYWETGLFENRVYPGIRRLLRMLKRRGDWVAIATGKPTIPSRRIIEHFGLNRYFDRIIGSQEAMGATKQDLIRAALPDQYDKAVMVGDRRFDIEGAHAAGIRAVGVGYGYGDEEEFRKAGCEAYAATVDDLIALLCPGDPVPAGAFISMEGLDGSGKSTQMERLTDALGRWGFEVQLSREPGGSTTGERIREILLNKDDPMEPLTEALLFAASRSEHVRTVIRPATAAGKVLLSDRFVDSSAAYQGGGRELGVSHVMEINREAVDGCLPLLTVYLDISHTEALKRRYHATAPDRLERESDAFHARVEAAYHELIRNDPARFLCVNARQSVDVLADEIARGVIDRLIREEERA